MFYKQRCRFKINFSFGFILCNRSDNSFRYWHVSSGVQWQRKATWSTTASCRWLLPADQDSLPAAWLLLAWTFVQPESRQARKFQGRKPVKQKNYVRASR